MTNPNDPAYASVIFTKDTPDVRSSMFGLTKREYFAAMALCSGVNPDYVGEIADRCIASLNKEAKP